MNKEELMSSATGAVARALPYIVLVFASLDHQKTLCMTVS
jgi:hypothetical protein